MDIFTPDDFEFARALPVPLLAWYDRCQREMPWRGARDSYLIWVSEIMLQQTRVEAVRAYFNRFTAALPTVRALAECDEDTLLKLWEGLGYYNRARNLQKAARLVMERHGGELPRTYEELLTLPGVGEYTAGAVASIAYGVPVPCVDGNVQRVLSRLLANPTDITLPAVKRAYQALAASLIPTGRAGDFNQSLMELGAMVCLPTGAPLCGQCPAAPFCRAHAAAQELDYPVKPAKAARRVEKRTVFIVLHDQKILLRRRPDTGLLAGLWQFPMVYGWLDQEQAREALLEHGPPLIWMRKVHAAKHIFTHIEWQMHGYLARVEDHAPPPDGRWVTLEELHRDFALPSALASYAAELEGWLKA